MARNLGGEGIVSPEEADQHEFTPEELRFLEQSGMRATIGNPEFVFRELSELAERYATDHLGIVTICYDFKTRMRSYELLAEHFLR